MAVSASTFSALGGAASDIFGGLGAFSAAKGYKSAAEAYLGSADTLKTQAGIYRDQAGVYDQMGVKSDESARIAGQSDRLQRIQAERALYGTLGGQRADIAGAGLMAAGSALDIIRDSTMQGALQLSVLDTNAQLAQSGYEQEKLSYAAMSKASEAAAQGSEAQASAAVGQAGMASSQASAAKKGGIGSIIKGALTIGAMVAFSDARLKTDIVLFDRREDGIGRYFFKYNDGENLYLGVLAQEVNELYPHAVTLHANGFFMVDYAAIGENMYMVGSA